MREQVHDPEVPTSTQDFYTGESTGYPEIKLSRQGEVSRKTQRSEEINIFMMGRDQRTKRMLVSYPKEITVRKQHKGEGLKIVQSYGSLRIGVSDCSSSGGFLERS